MKTALRLLAGMGVWRHNDDWWGAEDVVLENFRDGEVIERRADGAGRE